MTQRNMVGKINRGGTHADPSAREGDTFEPGSGDRIRSLHEIDT